MWMRCVSKVMQSGSEFCLKEIDQLSPLYRDTKNAKPTNEKLRKIRAYPEVPQHHAYEGHCHWIDQALKLKKMLRTIIWRQSTNI